MVRNTEKQFLVECSVDYSEENYIASIHEEFYCVYIIIEKDINLYRIYY